MTPQLIHLIGVGAIPLLTSLFSSPKWPPGVRGAVACALCVALALWQSHGQFGPDVAENAFKVIALVQGLYHGLLKHIGLPALEKGSTEAWESLLKGLASQGGGGSPASRLKALTALYQEGAISEGEYNTRRAQILEGV